MRELMAGAMWLGGGIISMEGYPDQRDALNKLFDSDVIEPFLRLISEIAKLSPQSETAIRIALASLRTTILLFSQKIGRVDVEKMILQKEAEYV